MTRMMDVECRQKGIDETKVRGWRMKRTNNTKRRKKGKAGELRKKRTILDSKGMKAGWTKRGAGGEEEDQGKQ